MTNIEWTDVTWNPIVGCTVVSPGCTNCYAMRMAGTRLKTTKPYSGLTQDTKAGPVWTGEVRFLEERLTQPLKWRKPRRVFVNSMGDLFHEGVTVEWFRQIWEVMTVAHKKHGHVFQVLTKRPERMVRVLGPRGIGWYAVERPVPCPEPGIWLGTSVEDQRRSDERIPALLGTPAAVRFLSCEPLLGPVELPDDGIDLDWIIVGGESGPHARDMNPDWARDIRDQCRESGVAFFMKQMSRKAPIPDDLKVREFPS